MALTLVTIITNGDDPETFYALASNGVIVCNTINESYNGRLLENQVLTWYSNFKSWLTRIKDNEYPTITRVEITTDGQVGECLWVLMPNPLRHCMDELAKLLEQNQPEDPTP